MPKIDNTEFLTAEELVKRWKGTITPATLTNWRYQKRGPAFVRMGGVILYPLREVEKYEKKNTHNF